ncbi:MAG: hypothetical protein Q8P34_07945 [Bacteroidota bacterium]|nr:hypothetical protein [Bacteroidota bacterium]
MRKYFKYLAVALVGSFFLLSSCIETDDVMTSNVSVGGLVTPVSKNIPYKLNATPSFDVSVLVPVGPAIQKVEMYKTFTNIDGKNSNTALLGTLDVNGSNATADFTGKVTLNYAALIKDLTVAGKALPANEGLLNIGEAWTITFVSIMSDDQRMVNNAATTSIGVANQYAGDYQCVGTFSHPTAGVRPINEKKFLKPLTAYSCNIPVGDLGGAGYFVDIVIDPVTNTVTYANGVPTGIIATADKRSYFEPSTGKFYLYYYYVGVNGNRIIEEVYTPIK